MLPNDLSPAAITLICYNRLFRTVNELTDKLIIRLAHNSEFYGPTVAEAVKVAHKKIMNTYAQSFRRCVLDYLRRPGHPVGTAGKTVTRQMFRKDRDDPVCRANMMLRGALERYSKPLDSWNITVSCAGLRYERQPLTRYGTDPNCRTRSEGTRRL